MALKNKSMTKVCMFLWKVIVIKPTSKTKSIFSQNLGFRGGYIYQVSV